MPRLNQIYVLELRDIEEQGTEFCFMNLEFDTMYIMHIQIDCHIAM